jgi:hypothetical protein
MGRQLYADVRQFVRRHLRCGTLRTAVDLPVSGAHRLTLECLCGATLERALNPSGGEAPAEDLLHVSN